MKKTILTATIVLTSVLAIAQSVGINTNTPAASAALDVSSTTQGMLVPRMLEAQRTDIASPATGLLVYQTDATAGFYFYNGSAWTSLNSGGSSGDNLGNHTATQNINMADNNLTNANNVQTKRFSMPSTDFVLTDSNRIVRTSMVNFKSTTSTGYIKITGGSPAGDMQLQGITPGFDGEILRIYNTTTTTLDISNNNGFEPNTDARILTNNGTLSVIAGDSFVTLLYDGTLKKWIMVSVLE